MEKKKKLGINDYHPRLGYVPASEIKRLRRRIREQMGVVKLAYAYEAFCSCCPSAWKCGFKIHQRCKQ
jgi:hypothetical protein